MEELEEKKIDENKEDVEEVKESIDDAENEEEVWEESIIVDNYIDEKNSDDIKKRDIELALQQLEIKIDAIEFGATDIEDLSDEELTKYYSLKDEYNKLLKELKEIRRNKKKKLDEGSIENVSIWIFFYGGILDLLSFPFIAYILYLNFGSFVLSQFSQISSLDLTGFFPNLLLWLIVFALPIILVMVSWFIYSNIKKKINKKVFLIFWFIQIVFTLISIIWLSIKLFG